MVIERSTYKDQVIQFIYREILKGNMKPGQQIKESKLSERLGISRAPIREALKELISMGIVEYKPRIGTFVMDPSPDEILQAYEARGVLEGYAAAKAMNELDPDQVAELYDMCEEMKDLAKNRENLKLIDLGDKFHEKITKPCKNDQIMNFSYMLSLKSHLMFSEYWAQLYTPEEIENRHRLIVDAIVKHSPEEVERVIRFHYMETGEKISHLKKGRSVRK